MSCVYFPGRDIPGGGYGDTGGGRHLVTAVTMYIQPRMKALAKHSFEDGQTKHSVMVESLTGLETLKLLGAGGFMRRRLREVLERQADISGRQRRYPPLYQCGPDHAADGPDVGRRDRGDTGGRW